MKEFIDALVKAVEDRAKVEAMISIGGISLSVELKDCKQAEDRARHDLEHEIARARHAAALPWRAL